VTVSNDRYTLRGDIAGTWLAVQRIRLREHKIGDAVEAARSFMRLNRISHASWWLSERSTPSDVEPRLLEEGLEIVQGDYLIDGLLLTSPPPHAPEIEARPVADADEHVAAVEAQYEAFSTLLERRRDAQALADEYERERQAEVVVLFAAWLDGRIVGSGRAICTPRGVLLAGGSTVPSARGRGVYRALVRARWDLAAARATPALAVQAGSQSAPILRRLGFEKVCQFRRLQDVASTG
jgi:GNAT superfamily N-acetyltransferase